MCVEQGLVLANLGFTTGGNHMNPELPSTQRAYPLRLTGDDPRWRDRLWRTHLAVNRGAAAFGDWLIKLRGGLDHRLAELPVKEKSGEQAPNADERRDRRLLLALSWLTVEVGYAGLHAVPADKIVATLREILLKRGVTEVEAREWETDCADSLRASIKDGATWVNRSAAFDAAAGQLGPSLTREEVWDLLLPFFGSISGYLEPVALEGDEVGADEKAKDLVQKAGQWLSSRFGTGQGADFTRLARVYDAMRESAATVVGPIMQTAFFDRLAGALTEFAPAAATPEAILSLISGPGYKSATRNLVKAFATQAAISAEDLAKFAETAAEDAEASRGKTGGKGHREWSDRLLAQVEAACGFSYLGALKSGNSADDEAPEREAARHSEFAVMLDHAARRVSLAHTWAKRAEAERRQFTFEAAKLTPLRAQHTAAVQWLDDFCARRSVSSHAEDAYRIRPRAVEGWKEVVAAWRKAACATAEDRVEVARTLQDSDQIDKFGDIQLFEALADDEASRVWESGPDLLLSYAKATDAQHKKQRFKVPAYCHPDPLRHPVFCDFGNSRWDVDFAFHRARTGTAEARLAVTRRREAVTKAEAQLAKAKDDTARADKQGKLAEAQTKLVESESRLRWLETPRAITLTLLDGDRPQPTGLRWQSKRLAADLALEDAPSTASPADVPAAVTRADRQGRAAAGVGPGGPVVVLGLFDQDHWNCRLQAPREQLDALAAHLEKHKLLLHDEMRWDERASRLRDKIEWLVTFSAKLQPQGPWLEFAPQHAGRIRPELKDGEMAIAPRGKSDWSGLAFPFWHLDNQKGRTGRTLHALSRLPGLRLLSADLGHRFGAACAVWETLSLELVRSLCGAALPGPDQLFHTVTLKGADGRDRTTVLRRIGADTLPDNKLHPAPWARLERQFLLKLQGEEADTRKASPAELGFMEELETACGLAAEFRLKQRADDARNGEDRRPSLDVDDVMSHAVDTTRLALKRHTTRARLARDFVATHRIEPGDRKADTAMDATARAEHLTRALLVWHDLATSQRVTDTEAARLWTEHVAPRLAERELEPRPEEREAAVTRKKRDERNSAKLAAMAAALTEGDCAAIAKAWEAGWHRSDAALRPLLARVRDWLRPRGLRGAARGQRIASRRTGGLSVTRLATLRSFYQVQKAFFTRLRPDGTHPTADEAFGQRTLDAMDRLREQRVKQLASRIAASALGLAPASPSPDERNADDKVAARLSRQRLGKLEPRFVPCHTVAIESLSNYRPDQLQTRRENRQLMQWSSSKVQKHLAEACQLSGLHLREVPPAYTSRQDSRTGAPGLRCTDVSLADFLRDGGYSAREAERVRVKKPGERKAGEQLLLDTYDHWVKAAVGWSTEQKQRRSVRLVREGADLFVSANPASPATKGLQADLNAAANIGLKALLDPDWEGSWWLVPCVRGTNAPKPETVKGCPLFNDVKQLAPPPAAAAAKKGKAEREFVNLWRDPAANALTTGVWVESTAYWSGVQRRVAEILRAHNGLPPEDDVPM